MKKIVSLMEMTVDQLDYPSDDGRGLVNLRRTSLKQDGFFMIPQDSTMSLDTFNVFPTGNENSVHCHEDWYLGCIRRDKVGGFNIAISRFNNDGAANSYLRYAPSEFDLRRLMWDLIERGDAVFMSITGMAKWNEAIVPYFGLIGPKR